MTDTTVGHSGDDSKAKARRAERYHARHLLWDMSKIARVRACGRSSRSADGVSVKVSTDAAGGRKAGFSGVVTCGSVWACPQCSAKVASGRQGDIEKGVSAWVAKGGKVGFLTVTLRHNKGHSLRTLFDAVASGWTATCSGRAWQEDQAEHGQEFARIIKTGKRAGQLATDWRIPTIRVWEVTHGDAGWHVHVHALVFLPGDATDESTARLRDSMWARWVGSVTDEGMKPSKAHGIDFRLLQGDAARKMGDYFTKNTYGDEGARSASFEMARGDLKDARWGNRTPFAILRGLVLAKSGELDPTELDVAGDEGLWAEWESASKGRRQVYWSPGLRAQLLPELPDELTDEELAAASVVGERVAAIPSLVYRQITRRRADYQVLSAFARSDRDGWDFLAQFFAMAEAVETARDARHGFRLGLKT